MTSSDLKSAFALSVGIMCSVAAGLVLANRGGGLFGVVILVLLVYGPGWAISINFESTSMAQAFTFATASGVSVVLLVGTGEAELRWWHPSGSSAVILFLSAFTLFVATFYRSWRKQA
jgi:hypothetical protein